MKTRSQVIGMFLCALALWAGAATQVAADQITDITLVPRLTITATVGTTNQIQYCTSLSQPDWVVLTNLVVTETNYCFVDAGAPPGPGRFYRVVVTVPTNNPAPTNMVLIQAGSFMMGDCMDDYDTEYCGPVHEVYLSAFYMDRYEVTEALWNQVKAWKGGNGYDYENDGVAKAANHPVVGVNWRDCVKWCNARSERDGLTPCYYNEEECTTLYKTGTDTPYAKWDANGYRLPTEAEWEKAARGGASGHRFPWTDTDSISHSRANYKADENYDYDDSYPAGFDPAFNDGVRPYTSPVGSFAPNGYGLYDMAGNAGEWCWDSWGGYSNDTEYDPHGPPSGGTSRIWRGSANEQHMIFCRVAQRGCVDMDYGTADMISWGWSMGLRSVRSAGP